MGFFFFLLVLYDVCVTFRKLLLLLGGAGLVASLTFTVWMMFGQGQPSTGSNLSFQNLPLNQSTNSDAISYVALGDSYTVGQGVPPAESWPAQLTDAVRAEGTDLSLERTLAGSGWRTEELIEQGLPFLASIQPQFATVMIGTNDMIRGVPPEVFRQNLGLILDTLSEYMPPQRIILITIPDYFATPGGQRYVREDVDSQEYLITFNDIIKREAETRGIALVDITDLSRELGIDPNRLTVDGFHPSAAGYSRWVQLITPTVVRLLAE